MAAPLQRWGEAAFREQGLIRAWADVRISPLKKMPPSPRQDRRYFPRPSFPPVQLFSEGKHLSYTAQDGEGLVLWPEVSQIQKYYHSLHPLFSTPGNLH